MQKSVFYLFIWGFMLLLTLYRSRRVVGRAEETSTYSLSGFCTVNCRPTASNYQFSHLRPCWESNPGLRGGRRECIYSAIVAPVEICSDLVGLVGLSSYHTLSSLGGFDTQK